jgi:2-polyprenyl-6-methoxyphenol hydroxylase-like FAD-dependent oxidoreductase
VPEHVVVVGGGVGGLASALALGRGGHRVTLLERDELPSVGDAAEAFAAERRGAPQAHQTHGFLARLVVVLRERFPDVLEDLRAAGGFTMSGAASLGEPRPGDEDLSVLIVRRTTFEWVLRKAVQAEPLVEVRTGTSVQGLVAGEPVDGVPSVAGVRLDDGTELRADAVVLATGRRGAVPGWLADIGVDVAETVRESGLVYLTRWYRLPEDFDLGADPKLGGDLGFVKFLAVPGDGGTLSVTLAVRADDAEVRSVLSAGDAFDEACRRLPGPDRFFADGPLEPIGPVRPMGGLLNRVRRFTSEGRPTVLGCSVVGDAHTCTNPLYGRGCSLALVQAVLLADAFAASPGDPAGRAASYEAGCAREVEPWFEVSVQMDRMGADPEGFVAGSSTETSEGRAFGAVLVAAATDPVIGRGMARFWNLLATPTDLMGDVELLTRMAEVMAEPEKWPAPPREGPRRDELLAALGEQEPAA